MTDYTEAGKNVLADLVSKWGGQWWDHGVNIMDCLYQDHSGGRLYVGGWQAAENLSLLKENKITHVVNCTTDLQCPHQDDIRCRNKLSLITFIHLVHIFMYRN